ncbi:hypothetical protein B0H11DRAFT_1928127 [Mycena galericulata]|nr:hypothetical protein B0H11DRAFT_1928127 [Mycena galericulata]
MRAKLRIVFAGKQAGEGEEGHVAAECTIVRSAYRAGIEARCSVGEGGRAILSHGDRMDLKRSPLSLRSALRVIRRNEETGAAAEHERAAYLYMSGVDDRDVGYPLGFSATGGQDVRGAGRIVWRGSGGVADEGFGPVGQIGWDRDTVQGAARAGTRAAKRSCTQTYDAVRTPDRGIRRKRGVPSYVDVKAPSFSDPHPPIEIHHSAAGVSDPRSSRDVRPFVGGRVAAREGSVRCSMHSANRDGGGEESAEWKDWRDSPHAEEIQSIRARNPRLCERHPCTSSRSRTTAEGAPILSILPCIRRRRIERAESIEVVLGVGRTGAWRTGSGTWKGRLALGTTAAGVTAARGGGQGRHKLGMPHAGWRDGRNKNKVVGSAGRMRDPSVVDADNFAGQRNLADAHAGFGGRNAQALAGEAYRSHLSQEEKKGAQKGTDIETSILSDESEQSRYQSKMKDSGEMDGDTHLAFAITRESKVPLLQVVDVTDRNLQKTRGIDAGLDDIPMPRGRRKQIRYGRRPPHIMSLVGD